MTRIRFRRAPVVAALALLVTTACGADDDTGDTAESGAGGDTAAETSTGETGSGAGKATVSAGDQSSTPAVERLRERIAAEYPQFQVDTIRPTPIDGIYEVVSDTDVMYMTADAHYLLRGALIDLEQRRNLTGERRSELVHAKVDALGEESMLVFPPADGPAKHTITVFTDHTCPYCQRLHEEVLAMVEEYPVEVRYLMFPRAGLGSSAADTLQDIWCADDPRRALTRAKRGQSVPAREAGCSAPIKQHFEAAQAVGINGTPYLLVGDDGPAVSGYRPKEKLLSMLGITPKDGQASSATTASGQRSAAAQ